MGVSMENILMNHRMQGYCQIHQSVADILLMTALPSNFCIFHGGNMILLGLARNRLIGRFPWQYPGLGRIRLCVIVGSPTISRENDETQQCFHCHLYLLRFPPKNWCKVDSSPPVHPVGHRLGRFSACSAPPPQNRLTTWPKKKSRRVFLFCVLLTFLLV